MFAIHKKFLVPFILLGCLSGCALGTGLVLVGAVAPGLAHLENPGGLSYWQNIDQKRVLIRSVAVSECEITLKDATKHSLRCAKLYDHKPLSTAVDYSQLIRAVITKNPNMIMPPPSVHNIVLTRAKTIEGTIKVVGANFTYTPKTTVKVAFESH